MNAPLILAPPAVVRVAVRLVEAVASWDECVLLLGESGADAVLDRAERELSTRRVRCVRVRAPASGGLSLSGLMAQVVGRADPGDLTDEDLQTGFAVLTEPGEGHDRVALMVEGAQALLPSAVRYIRLACRSGPHLRVVLAGRPGLDAVLVGDEFADLRRRFTRRLAPPDLEAYEPADDPAPDGRSGPFSAAPEPPSDPPSAPGAFARLRDMAWTLAKLGLAASLVVWMARLGSPVPPPPPRAVLPEPAGAADEPFHADPPRADASRADASRADASRADPPRPAPSRADPPRAGSGAPLAVWTTRWEDGPTPPAAPAPEPGRRADPVGADPLSDWTPTGRETPAAVPPVAATPFDASTPGEADAPPVRRSPPADAAPPGVADAPTPAAAASTARDRAEEGPPPAPAVAPALIESAGHTPAGGATPPARRDIAAERDAASAPPPEPPREQAPPPVRRQAAPAAGPDAPETPAPGRAATRVPDPAPASPPSAPPDSAAPLPLPPVPPQQPPRSPGTTPPSPETPAVRRPRGPVERAATPPASAPAARPDERRCRDLVVKFQLGEALSDADRQFLRGGCRAD